MQRIPTEKQQKFADHYIKTGNATQSALAAGYTESASKRATALLTPTVQAYIKRKTSTAAKRYAVTEDRVMRELARVAFSDPKVLAKHGLKLENYDEDQVGALELEIEEGPNGRKRKIKYQDKISALDKLAKILRLYPDKSVNVQTAMVVPGLKELLEKIDGKDTGIGPASSRITQDKPG